MYVFFVRSTAALSLSVLDTASNLNTMMESDDIYYAAGAGMKWL
jgi:hypothetical protein